ncbi:MAG TPA: hypothetical protein DHV62_05640, partial [Elusimicrobia bacterium]|nr:hypothetical protein [Elusimicrobiota bacterium]
ILPIYPFLFVLLSQTIQPAVFSHQRTIIFRFQFLIFSFLCIWYLISSLRIYPHYLAYFNEFSGGPDNGWKYLADSNIDWGQDLKGLKKYLEKEDNPEILLGYYGSANPDYYHIEYQKLPFYVAVPRMSRKINSLNPQKELLAISVNILHSIYSPDRSLFNWLKKKKPIGKIGYSIFVYDVTLDIDAHENLAQFYFNNGRYKEAERECGRLLILDPENSIAHFTLSCLYAEQGEEELAINEYEKVIGLNADLLPRRYVYYIGEGSSGQTGEFYHRALFILGAIYFKKDEAKALNIYQKIVQLYPDSFEGYNNLGVVYEELSRDEQAISSYQRAIQLKPDFADAYFNLAVVYWSKNEWNLVVKNLLEVLRINPQHQEARKYLSLAQEKLKTVQ